MKKSTKHHQQLQDRAKYLLVLGIIVLLACSAVYMLILQTVQPMHPERLVTFYDQGTERSIVTRASTVAQALQSAGIVVDPNDIIEPTIDSVINKSSVDIIIYRSRPVAVADGAIRQTVMTPLQAPNEIAKAAGLKALDSKDKSMFRQGAFVADRAPTVLVLSRAKVEVKSVVVEPPVVVFVPKPNALTSSKGAQVYVDTSGVAHRETYYDLPMNIVMQGCGVGSTYTVRSDGAKVDQDGYILVAANFAAYPRCSVVDTSMGPGKVYDTGGFVLRHPYGFDLATDWTVRDGI